MFFSFQPYITALCYCFSCVCGTHLHQLFFLSSFLSLQFLPDPPFLLPFSLSLLRSHIFLQFLYLSVFTFAGVLASLQTGPFFFALQAFTDHFLPQEKKNQKKTKKKENLSMKERKAFAPIFLYGLS
jgi:hypothetical protein